MTVEGNTLQGLSNTLNSATDFLMDAEVIRTRRGTPFLNSVESRLTMQDDGNLVLYYRESKCKAWVEEDKGSEMTIDTVAFDCSKDGIVCFCAGTDSDGNIDSSIKDERRAIASENKDKSWIAAWSTATNTNARNGPYALGMTTGGDLTVIDGDGTVIWRAATGNAGPISCATVIGVKRMPHSWEDSQVNVAVYRSETLNPRDACTDPAAATLTLVDPDLVWTTAYNAEEKSAPMGTKGLFLKSWVRRTDDLANPFCTIQDAVSCDSSDGQLCSCQNVPDGATEMRPGQVLRQGQTLQVDFGTLAMQTDGNLVLYIGDDLKPVWHSHTTPGMVPDRTQEGPYALVMTSIAELVIVDKNAQVLWYVDSMRSLDKYFNPDHLLALDKILSPITLIESMMSYGISGTFFAAESTLAVVSAVHDFDQWRFRMQDDGNAVLYAPSGIALFQSHTYDWRQVDDEWPKAVLEDFNMYGDGWARFDPRTGEAFF